MGWAMVLPQTNKAAAYVPDRTGVGIGLFDVYSSPDNADRILAYAGIYPVPDWSTLASAHPTCAVVTELTARG